MSDFEGEDNNAETKQIALFLLFMFLLITSPLWGAVLIILATK